MGIAKFYGWLKRKNYKGSIQTYVPQNVSSFSFDLNGLIHKVAQEVYAYGEGENPVRRKLIEKMEPHLLEAEFHLAFGTKLSQIITSVQPMDTLVLAVDGVAPQAKIAQQRQRRFRAAIDAANSSTKEIFQSSVITPGTDFMMRLDNYIQRWIISAKKTLPPKVIYSSHMVPAEGEHKIFSMFREGQVTGDGAHVVYGMDADLIMLSMLSPLDRIYLMREDIRDVVNIDNLKMGIMEEMLKDTSIPDFVVMVFLLGNDFLPHLVTLSDMEEALETMIRIYQMNQLALTDGTEINWEGFTNFIGHMATEEPRLLELESERDVKHPSAMMDLATSKTEIIGVGKVGGIVKSSRFSPDIFRAAWYENAFRLKSASPTDNKIDVFEKLMPEHKFGTTNSKVVEMTKDYLTGITWVYRYYTSGKNHVNNDFVYRYLYAPMLTDISVVMKKYQPDPELYYFNVDALEINPVHQLLAVLPLRSKHILPEEVQHLMKIDSPIGDYYPQDILLDRQGYNTDWQGVLLINFVDMKRIQEAVENTSVFTPDRIKQFSPVMTIVLVKDPAVVEMERKNRTFKQYLSQGQGRGRGRGFSRREPSEDGGRGFSRREPSEDGGRGRGSYQSGGRGRGEYQGGRGRGSYQSGRGRGGYSQGGRGRGEYQGGRGRGSYSQGGRGRGQVAEDKTFDNKGKVAPVLKKFEGAPIPTVPREKIPVKKFEL